MADIQSATAEIRREIKKRKKKKGTTGQKNTMACPIPYGGHKNRNAQTKGSYRYFYRYIFVSDIAIFVLKRDVKLQLTNKYMFVDILAA